jgi:hypothetical protein
MAGDGRILGLRLETKSFPVAQFRWSCHHQEQGRFWSLIIVQDPQRYKE